MGEKHILSTIVDSLTFFDFCHCYAAVWTLTVLWTLKSDREAISLSNSSVADVAEGFAELGFKENSCFK